MTEVNLEIFAYYLLGSLFYFLLFLVTTYIAKMKGFLSLPFRRFSGVCSTGSDVFFIGLFFILAFGSTGFFMAFSASRGAHPSLLHKILIPLSPFIINIVLVGVYAWINSKFRLKGLIKDNLYPGKKNISTDIRDGFIALVLSFPPLFVFISALEAFSLWMNLEQATSQDAVAFLMQAKQDPINLFIALICIVIGSPIIEEFLFRGVIQSYLRKKAGSIASIVLTSAFFSLFHFSLGQGIQNIPIIISLFILSLYLGFIYEKTRSLFSPLTLHVTFNVINAIKIIFYSS
jgi:membrane protease YdiL (CAAX protease family)